MTTLQERLEDRFHFYAQPLPQEDVHRQVVDGLKQTPKRLSPKFFYDEYGSSLFTKITRLPEYYPTRTEIALLSQYGDDIAAVIGDNCTLIEYGSGSSEKIQLLLNAVKPDIYAPLDISTEYLEAAASQVASAFPWLTVHATSTDYSQEVILPFSTIGRRVAFFPGSSIGNFTPDDATRFLGRVADLVGRDGAILIGVDLKKEVTVLEAAYNDSEGVTAAFNRNILTHLNELLDGDFDTQKFAHLAFYNELEGRIEMHLRSLENQSVKVAGQAFSFVEDELIHTENSYKYGAVEFEELALDAGFRIRHRWTDNNEWFSLFYLESNR